MWQRALWADAMNAAVHRLRHAFDPAHLADLARSGLTEQDAVRMRTRSLNGGEAEALVGDCRAGYSIPYFEFNGTPRDFYRVRFTWFAPAEKFNGRPVIVDQQRYSQPAGSKVHLYLPPVGVAWQTVRDDPSIPITVTEGEKKSYAMCRA